MFWFGGCQKSISLCCVFFPFFFFPPPAFAFSLCLSGAPLLQTQGSLAAEPPRLWHGLISRAALLAGEGRGRNAKSPFPCSPKLQGPGRVLGLRAHLEAIQAERLLSSGVEAWAGGEGKEVFAFLLAKLIPPSEDEECSVVSLFPPSLAPALLQRRRNANDYFRGLK